MQKETERLKKLTHEERLREEKEKQTLQEKKTRKREIEIITEEKTKLIIEDFFLLFKKKVQHF